MRLRRPSNSRAEKKFLPLGMGAGAWGASVEERASANFSQHENTKQNLRYSMAAAECG